MGGYIVSNGEEYLELNWGQTFQKKIYENHYSVLFSMISCKCHNTKVKPKH